MAVPPARVQADDGDDVAAAGEVDGGLEAAVARHEFTDVVADADVDAPGVGGPADDHLRGRGDRPVGRAR